MDYVVFNIVKGHLYSHEDETLLMKEIRERIPEPVRIELNYVEKIGKTKSGKLRLVISDIK